MQWLRRLQLWLMEKRLEHRARKLIPEVRVELLRTETATRRRFLETAREVGLGS